MNWSRGTLRLGATALLAAGMLLPLSSASAAPLSALVAATAKSGAVDKQRLELIDDILEAEVAAGKRSGYVAMVATSDGIVYETAVGLSDIENNEAMEVGTKFRIASMTKPIVSLAAMRLVEEGKLNLTEPVAKYIPAYATASVATDGTRQEDGTYPTRPAKRPILVKDLLTHTAGIGYAFQAETDLDKQYYAVNPFFAEGNLEQSINIIASMPLYFDPGEKWFYSYSIDVLGRVIEVASGKELGAYLKETIFEPLGMNDTFFLLEDEQTTDLAKVYTFTEEGKLVLPGPTDPLGRGTPQDINKNAFAVASGGGGLVSTAGDYAKFCQMVLNGGSLDRAQIISGATLDAMFTNQLLQKVLPATWQATGLGFGLGGQVVVTPGLAGPYDADGDWRWGGYWDTAFVVNDEYDVAVILMTQREPGPNAPSSDAFDRVKAIAYSAVTAAK